MRSDKFFDALGEIDEKYIIVKLRIPRLRMTRRIVLSAILSFAGAYLLSSALFALLLPDPPAYPLLEGQLRQLTILVINALAGACSAPLLRRFIRREDYRSYVVFSVMFFLLMLAIGYVLFHYSFSVTLRSDESQGLWPMIAKLFPQVLVTAFSAPALIAQLITLFVVNKFSKRSAHA